MAAARTLTNAFIAAVVGSMAVDGLPVFFDAHARLKEALDPALDAAGIWQGSWRLFGPNVHKLNGQVIAEVTMSDGSRRQWASPDFRDRTLADKFVQGRLPKLYDNLRRDRYRGAWRAFAEWTARQIPGSAGVAPVEVDLRRRFSYVPAPGDARPPVVREHVFYRLRLEGGTLTRLAAEEGR